MKIIKQKIFRLSVALTLLFGTLEPFAFPFPVFAANATGYVRLDRVKLNTATGGSVCFNPTASETTVRQMAVTFPVSGTPGTADSTHFGVNQTAANWTWDTTSTNLPNGTSAFPGTATTSTVSNGVITFIVTADQSLNTGTTYCLHFTATSTLTTPTSAGNNFTGTIALNNSGGTQIGSELVNYASSIISNDQISVTATVTSGFTMSLSSNTAALGNLPTSGAPATAAITLTVSTNAANGWTSWVKNANSGSKLTSATTSDTSIASGAFSGGSNTHNLTGAAGYGLAVTSGTATIATDYNVSTPTVGSLDSTQFEKIASETAPASAHTVTLTFAAEAAATTKPASDYTDTVTVLAAGQF